MKTLTLFSIIFFSLTTSFAQESKFQSAMQKGVEMTDQAKTAEEFLAAANYFERIASAEKAEWLPQYYTAYNTLISAIVGTQSEETKDALYDKAMQYAEKAGSLKPEDSEIFTLKSYITFMKMSVSPQARAMAMIPASNELIERAIALDAENPRAYLIKGQSLFYTPEMFGGGKAKAKEVLLVALSKFEASKVAGFAPNWGHSRCKTLLSQIE